MESNKTFLAIIIGAVIIGGFLYLGVKDNNSKLEKTQVNGTPGVPIISNKQDIFVKSDLTTTVSCGAADNAIVTKVIDGDTVVVEGGYHVRIIGMDADETGYSCYLPAKTRLEALVLGKQVLLEKDKTDVDQYGRCLRYIFIGNINVGVQLVKEGLAIASFYESGTKYKAEIAQAEKYAQQKNLGCK